MDLHVTLASGPPTAFPAREIVVDTDALPTGAALAARFEAAGYLGPFAVDGVPLATLVPHVGALVDGAVIVSGGRAEASRPAQVPPLVFVVHSGPDAGRVVPLPRGSYTIGRSAGDIVVSDPALSRNHALLTVTEDSILLEDLGSANGTFVDGKGITRAPITVAANLRLGASRCRIELIDDEGWKAVPTADLLEPLPVGPDLPHQPSRLLVLTALLPLVVGVVLALTTGMWFFLAFSALSAVTGLVPLLTYRRSARIFGTAVRRAAEQDRVRRVRAVPDPGQTALDALRACRQRPRGPDGTPPAPEVLLLRLGTAHQPAHLSIGRDAESFSPPTLADLPLVLPCRPRGTDTGRQDFSIAGDTDAVQALARAVLLQLAHPESGAPPVLCWGSAADVPHSARFLPNVRLTRDPLALGPLLEQTGVRLVLQFSNDLPHLPHLPGAQGVFVVRFAGGQSSPASVSGGSAAAGAGMTIAAGHARARIDGREYDVLPDGVSARTFERAARTLARAAAGTAEPAARPGAAGWKDAVPPRSASLWTRHGGPDDLATTARGRWSSADAAHPRAYLGESGTGPVSIDLVRDGPHLLVAGTTGSGKSELLRTFVLGLALDQAPEHLALLLIDFKGGSGLGTLASLPHCVGSLTDLSSESTGRALTSLRAELRRREQLCAEQGAYGLAELRRMSPSSCPPRLVVVIDEFRMLSDEVPTAVADLMKIAALGRSLGVHLVLATQRAQGAVTPDIRANITSSVLLRVQTAGESQDLLGSAAAADISIDIPGRAFLRRGTEPPIAFQVASCSDLPAPADSPGWQDLDAYLGGGPGNGSRPAAGDPAPRIDGTGDGAARIGPRDPSDTAGASVLQRAAGNVAAAALRHSGAHERPGPASAPRRPVLPPLPATLSPAGCAAFPPAHPPSSLVSTRPACTVALGVADFPDRQEQRLLQWRPGDHSHLALVGLPGSGANEALGSAVASLLADPHVHLYLLDGDGTLAGYALSPQVGAHVRSSETKRAGRVLERLAALPGRQGDEPSIVLVITGWGRWSSQFRHGRFARAEDDLHAVVRDGAPSGVTVLIDGDRDLTSSRFFALLPNRVYLPLGAHAETTMTWPKLPPIDPVAGRGFAQGRITGSWGDGTCQLVLDSEAVLLQDRPPARPPFPVHPLPLSVPFGRLAPLSGAGKERGDLLLGVCGDDLRPYSVSVRPGEVYLVLGHPSSGRTNALRILAASAARLPRRTVLAPSEGAGREEAAAFWRGVAGRRAGPTPWERCFLVVDDADSLPGDVQQALSGLVASGAAAVLSATPSHALMARVPLSLLARGTGRGFVLSPRSAGDGDFFGVRLDVDGPPIPGRGYACDPAHTVEVQVALAPGADAASPAGRTGPAGPPGPTAFYRPRSFAP